MLSAFNHIEPTEQTALAERLAACPDSPITVTLGGGAPVVDEHGHEPPARATGTLNSPGRSSRQPAPRGQALRLRPHPFHLGRDRLQPDGRRGLLAHASVVPTLRHPHRTLALTPVPPRGTATAPPTPPVAASPSNSPCAAPWTGKSEPPLPDAACSSKAND